MGNISGFSAFKIKASSWNYDLQYRAKSQSDGLICGFSAFKIKASSWNFDIQYRAKGQGDGLIQIYSLQIATKIPLDIVNIDNNILLIKYFMLESFPQIVDTLLW